MKQPSINYGMQQIFDESYIILNERISCQDFIKWGSKFEVIQVIQDPDIGLFRQFQMFFHSTSLRLLTSDFERKDLYLCFKILQKADSNTRPILLTLMSYSSSKKMMQPIQPQIMINFALLENDLGQVSYLLTYCTSGLRVIEAMLQNSRAPECQTWKALLSTPHPSALFSSVETKAHRWQMNPPGPHDW